jgi:hypothetical protein
MANESALALREPQSILPNVIEPVESSRYNNPALRIDFCHPGYEFPHDTLLTLHAFDHPGGGIHHNTALVACAIIAGNHWHGYLTEMRDGPRITAARDEVLRGRKYYFHVPETQQQDDGTSVARTFIVHA